MGTCSRLENSEIKLIRLVNPRTNLMNRRIRRRKRIWVRELTVKAKKKKRFCRRKQRICPDGLLTNKTKKSTEGWTDIPLHSAQGEGNGEEDEEDDDDLAVEYAVSSAWMPGSGSIDARARAALSL